MTVIPVNEALIVPEANLYFKTDAYEHMAKKSPVVDERVILILTKEDVEREHMDEQSFYPVGVSGHVAEVNPNGYVMIRTEDRVDLEDVAVYTNGNISLFVKKRDDIADLPEETEEAHLKDMKKAILEYVEKFQWGQMTAGYVNRLRSVSEILAMMSPWIDVSREKIYAILKEDSRAERLKLMEQIIYENLEMLKVNTEARTAQEEDYQKIYRESAIKKQIEYLQKELDEMHPESVSDVRKYEIKIEESGMNKTARTEAEKVLNRLKHEGQNSAESGMLYDYLDFVTGLSWKTEEPEPADLKEAEDILNEDHFGLKKVKERIIQQIAVMSLRKKQAGSILLFVGAPGTGKTSIGRSIAKALHREYVRVSLGGVRDEADIRGHRRTYIGAMPGRIMDGIRKSGVSNPVMVLDEVDKLSASYNGDPASALLEVLDPEQNNTFTDHYMNVPYDLSNVFFICTANSMDTIPEPLLNRMEVISFQGYTPAEKFQIARRHLIPKALESAGIDPKDFAITDEALETVISDYTREGGVRGLKKRIDSLCRMAAVKLVRGQGEKFVIEKGDLREALDMHPLPHNKVAKIAKPGIVTGLAWTAVGGEILYIETLFTKGSGKTVITGQLGDVMQESAKIAVSLVKSMFPDKAEMFEKNDLHIHVPDGATPKDGPSAGITLTTALASLVNGTAVSPTVAMTGEVSLRGGVNPIGGLPEKLMAAQRSGVKRVFIPAENVEDLRDVADEVKDALEIIPVSDVTEVLQKLGIPVTEETEKAS